MCERYTICCTCCEQLTVIYGYTCTMALGPVREWGEQDPFKKNTPLSTWQGFQKTSNWRESTEKTM